MSEQKGMWDVVSDFGKIGIISFCSLTLLLWGLIHFLAEPGKTVDFAFWSYTKPLDVVSSEQQIFSQFQFILSSVGISSTFGRSPCEEIRLHDREMTELVLEITKTNMFVEPEEDGVIRFRAGDTATQLYVAEDTWTDNPIAPIFLTATYQNVKTHCLGGEAAPLNLSTWMETASGDVVKIPSP
jgi:hypothetical protein